MRINAYKKLIEYNQKENNNNNIYINEMLEFYLNYQLSGIKMSNYQKELYYNGIEYKIYNSNNKIYIEPNILSIDNYNSTILFGLVIDKEKNTSYLNILRLKENELIRQKIIGKKYYTQDKNEYSLLYEQFTNIEPYTYLNNLTNNEEINNLLNKEYLLPDVEVRINCNFGNVDKYVLYKGIYLYKDFGGKINPECENITKMSYLVGEAINCLEEIIFNNDNKERQLLLKQK